jgi:hypothetical protein
MGKPHLREVPVRVVDLLDVVRLAAGHERLYGAVEWAVG